jgi:pyruvate dehydrogenase E2 component (dihydrolipoamide acetyltransferase)
MPSLGADMTQGTLLEWLVQPGDAVHRGDIVAVVDTSKAEIEIEIFEDGVVGELLVGEGTKVPVGTPLATILPPGSSPAQAATGEVPAKAVEPVVEPEPEASAEPEPEPTPGTERARTPEPVRTPTTAAKRAEPAEPTAAPPAPEPSASGTREPLPLVHGRPRVSPLARRAAAEAGIRPEGLHGTGWGGAVVLADVEAEAHHLGLTHPESPATSADRGITDSAHDAAASPAPAAGVAGGPATSERRDATDRQAAMREAIGGLMARSKREIPHFYLEQHIDLHAALTWLAAHNAELPVRERVLPAALLLAASARAARAVPELNGAFEGGAAHRAPQVHLGVALALRGGGLVAPAIHDADQLGIDALMAKLADLAGRARAGKLRGSEMTDATITVTSLGDRGADRVDGVIYPPQLAVIGFGRIRERPWAEDGLVGARPTVFATLAADHRAADGHAGSRLLVEIDRLLQHPEEFS